MKRPKGRTIKMSSEKTIHLAYAIFFSRQWFPGTWKGHTLNKSKKIFKTVSISYL